MRKPVAVLLVVAVFAQAGCAYLKDRGADCADILTLSVEDGNVGATVQTFGAPSGVSWSEGKGFGLRSGCAGTYEYKEKVVHFFTFTDVQLPQYPHVEKEFRPASPRGKKGYRMRVISAANRRPRWDDRVFAGPWQMYTQFAGNVGMYGGIRLGLNVGEFCDFVLGWTALDICRDDIGSTATESPIVRRHTGIASVSEPQVETDQIMTGRVLDVHMLGTVRETVTVCHFDPRYVVVVQTESGVKKLAIHSPTLTFMGVDPVGKNYRFDLSKRDKHFLLKKAEEIAP